MVKSDVPAAGASTAASLPCQTWWNMGKLKEMDMNQGPGSRGTLP